MKRLLALALALISPVNAYGRGPGTDLPPNFNTDKVAHVLGEITEMSAFGFETEMLRTADLPGDRLILIDSPGGSVEAGQKMIDAIHVEQAYGVKVVCVVIHNAHSMAFNLLTECDVRLATPNARMLVHKVALGGCEQDVRLTAVELRREAEEMDRVDRPYRRANARAMHLSLKDYDLYADHENMWTARQLLERGYLTGIIPR